MKKKLLYGLMLVVMSLCSVSGWAERVAPTLPTGVTPQTLESGKEYYLLNVGSGFLGGRPENTNNPGISLLPKKIIIKQQSKGYSMKLTDSGSSYYIVNDHNRSYQIYNSYQSYGYSFEWCAWDFIEDGDLYKIRSAPGSYGYQDNCYLGSDNNSDFLYGNKTEGNIYWQLFDANTDISRYVAEYNLFIALNDYEKKLNCVEDFGATDIPCGASKGTNPKLLPNDT